MDVKSTFLNGMLQEIVYNSFIYVSKSAPGTPPKQEIKVVDPQQTRSANLQQLVNEQKNVSIKKHMDDAKSQIEEFKQWEGNIKHVELDHNLNKEEMMSLN